MNEVKVFQFRENEVRVVGVNGEPWFVAKDVADVLGYRMASDMCRRLDEDEKGTQKTRTLGGEQEVTVINESGLYNAVLGSSKPEAKAFKKWVTSEVLPSIRKHGAYVTNEKLSEWLADPTHMIEALTALKEERKKVRALEQQREVLPRRGGDVPHGLLQKAVVTRSGCRQCSGHQTESQIFVYQFHNRSVF